METWDDPELQKKQEMKSMAKEVFVMVKSDKMQVVPKKKKNVVSSESVFNPLD